MIRSLQKLEKKKQKSLILKTVLNYWHQSLLTYVASKKSRPKTGKQKKRTENKIKTLIFCLYFRNFPFKFRASLVSKDFFFACMECLWQTLIPRKIIFNSILIVPTQIQLLY